MNYSLKNYLREDFSPEDWNAIGDLGQHGLNPKIYDAGENYAGEFFSRVEISIFDMLLGNKHVLPLKDAEVYLGIFKKHYPRHYEQFKSEIE